MSTAKPSPEPFDPIRAAAERAPRVQRLTAEQRAELDVQVRDIAEGRTQLVAHNDVPAWLEQHARDRGELGE
jgi:hypothetical protein